MPTESKPKKNQNRGKKQITPGDCRSTSRLLEKFAKLFADLADEIETKERDFVLATGAPTVMELIDRLDAHYNSCREDLGYLNIGEPKPEFSYLAKHAERKPERKPIRKP